MGFGLSTTNPRLDLDNKQLPESMSKEPRVVDNMTSIIPNNGGNPQDLAEKAEDSSRNSQTGPGGSGTDSEEASKEQDANIWDWSKDPANPYNWPSGKKAMQIAITASIALLA